MARRGVKIGDAYIEIHGDNSDWRKAVARQRKAWLEDEKKAGDRFEKLWADSQDRTVQRTMRKIIDAASHRDFDAWVKKWGSVDEAVRRIDAGLNDMYRSTRKNNLMTREQYQRVVAIRDAWAEGARERELAQKLARDQLAATKEAERVEKVRIANAERMNRLHQQAINDNERMDVLWAKIESKYRRVYKIRGDLADRDRAYIRDVLDRHVRGVETLSENWQRVGQDIKDAKEFQDAYYRAEALYLERSGRRASHLTDRRRALIAETARRDIDGIERMEEYYDRTIRRIRTRNPQGLLGRMAGSRNDLLNLIGRVFQPIERAGRRLGSVFDRLIQRGLEPLIDRFAEGGPAAQRFGSFIGSMGGKFGGLVTILIEAGVALMALNLILGPLVALLSSLAGMITAVASSIMAGLVGTLATALPILGAAAVGVGALVVGISGMTDAQKASLEPMEEWAGRLQGIVADKLFENLSGQVEGFVDSLGPHFERVLGRSATAISDTVDSILETIEGADFQNVLRTLERHLPNIVGNVTDMFGSLGIAVAGVMSSISPQVDRLVEDWATKLSDWADWAISPQGQKSISMWFDDMLDSAEELWDLFGSIGDLFGALTGSDELTDTGDSWISGWADSIRELADYISSPQGGKAIHNWMEDAKETASNLGDIIDQVADLFDTLNTDENKERLQDFLNVVEDGIDLFEDLQGAMEAIRNTKLIGGIFSLNDIFDGVSWVTNFIANLDTLPSRIGKWWANIDWRGLLSVARVGADIAAGFIGGIVDALIPDEIVEAFEKVVDWVKGVFGIASPSTVMYDIGVDVVQGLIDGMLSMLGPLGEAARSLLDVVDQVWNGGEGGFSGVTGRALEALSGLVPGLGLIMGQTDNLAKSGVQSLGKTFDLGTQPIPNQVKKNLSPLSGNVGAEASKAASAGAVGLAPLAPRMGSTASNAVSRVRNALGALDNATASAGKRAANAGVSAFGSFASRMGSVASSAVGRVRAYSGSMYSAGYSVGYSAGKGMLNGLSALEGAVAAKAASIAKKAAQAARSAQISRSPSLVWRRIGESAVEGFLIPFETSLGKVGDASTQMVETMLGGIDATSMFARGRAASDGLVSGLRSGSGFGVSVPSLGGGASGVAGRGGTYIAPGAIQIQSNAKDSRNAAGQFLDRLAVEMVGG